MCSDNNTQIKAKYHSRLENYNEQYSRKFNIKVTNFSVDTDTDIKEKFIEMVKDDLKLELDERDVVAIHKLKTKKPVAIPPVIVKVLNSDIKRSFNIIYLYKIK